MEVWIKEYRTQNQEYDLRKFNELRSIAFHQHLVNFIGFLNDKREHPFPLFLTEYANSDPVASLFHAITNEPPYYFTSPVRLRITQEILPALYWLHELNKIKHLRLKPSNILFFSQGEDTWISKVADYGLGFCTTSDDKESYSHVQYYAPEMCEDPSDDSKADVWSFGMLLYTLFTYKEPFERSNTKEKIKKITEEQLLKQFKDIKSPTLVQLLGDCCKRDPSQRLSFSKIIQKYDKAKLTNILSELDITAGITTEIWKAATSDGKEIPFKKFIEFLVDYFSIKPDTEEHHYLKEALRLPSLLKQQAPDPQTITFEQFSIICQLFKINKEKDDGFIKRIVEVFKADWFYGCVDRTDAQNKLERFKAKKGSSGWFSSPPVLFIIRYANSKQLCFTYQKKDGTWENSNIDPNIAIQDNGYVQYITKYQKSMLGLKHELVPHLQKTFSSFPIK